MKTARNPFKPVHRQTALASDMRSDGKFKSKSSRMIGAGGEINASSKSDLVGQIGKMMTTANTYELRTDMQQRAADEAKLHRRMVKAAVTSRAKHAELGETIGEELYATQNREGLMRSFLNRMDLADGENPRIKLRNRNILAIFATSPTASETQLVRDNYFYPTEYYIQAKPYMEMQEIRINKTDVLEDKYLETLQAFMVQEDRIFFDLAKRSIGQSNDFTTVFGSIDPTGLARFRNQVDRWGIRPDWWCIANDLWIDIAGNAGFQQLFEPVAKHEIVLTGQLGTILGLTVKSDAFRFPEHRVLNQGEMYIIGAPENLGTYTDRGGIETSPIDQAHTGIPGRGWMMHLQQSQTLSNSRAIACGIRR